MRPYKFSKIVNVSFESRREILTLIVFTLEQNSTDIIVLH